MATILYPFTKTLRRIFSDPSIGIEYNSIGTNRKISRCVYNVDIARTPQIVRNDLINCDVQNEARFANSERELLDQKARRFKGRS